MAAMDSGVQHSHCEDSGRGAQGLEQSGEPPSLLDGVAGCALAHVLPNGFPPSIALGNSLMTSALRVEDFQQKGLEASMIEGAYYLGHVDRDYHAHVVGATVQLRF